MKKKGFKKFVVIGFWIVILLTQFVTVVYAAFDPKVYPDNPGLPGSRTSSINTTVIDVITKILLPIAAVIAVVFIIIGGFRYITSAGNEELAEAGKKTLTNSIIGLVVIILSYIIVQVIFNTLYKIQ